MLSSTPTPPKARKPKRKYPIHAKIGSKDAPKTRQSMYNPKDIERVIESLGLDENYHIPLSKGSVLGEKITDRLRRLAGSNLSPREMVMDDLKTLRNGENWKYRFDNHGGRPYRRFSGKRAVGTVVHEYLPQNERTVIHASKKVPKDTQSNYWVDPDKITPQQKKDLELAQRILFPEEYVKLASKLESKVRQKIDKEKNKYLNSDDHFH